MPLVTGRQPVESRKYHDISTAGTLDNVMSSIASATDGVFSVASAEENDLSEVPSEATSRPFKLFYSLQHSETTSSIKKFFYLDEDSANIFYKYTFLYASKE